MIDPVKKTTDERLIALRCPADAWPRTLLSAAPIPDKWMGLVIHGDGRRRLVPAGEAPRGEREDTLVLVRNRPIATPVALAGAASSDGHAIEATVELLLRCPMREDELASLRAALLVGETLTLSDLEKAVRDAGAVEALREFVKSQPAGQLVHEDLRDALTEHLRAALRRFLFAAGLEIERIGGLSFNSRTLTEEEARNRDVQRQTREIETRRVVEDAALTATKRRVEGLSAILDKLKAFEQPGAGRWHALLPALTPSERGRLLENLWRITPDRSVAEAIVVVAGLDCLWLDPQQPDQIVRRVTLPGDLGGLRSVAVGFGALGDRPPAGLSSNSPSPSRQAEDRPEAGPPASAEGPPAPVQGLAEQDPPAHLLIGAAGGVWLISAADGAVLARLDVPAGAPPTTGFNSAVLTNGTLVATHSQLGCWMWELSPSSPAAPRTLLAPEHGEPKAIRAATATGDGHILFAADSSVRVHAPDGAPVRTLEIGRGAVHSIATDQDRVFVATSDGLLLTDNWRSPNVWEALYRGREAIETVQRRRWDDLVELVIPAGEGGVLGVYSDEGVSARLMTSRVAIRRAWACDDLIVGLSALRDRLVVLNANLAETAPREVVLARLASRSIQDACIVTRRAS